MDDDEQEGWLGKIEHVAPFLDFLRAFNETKGQIFLSSQLLALSGRKQWEGRRRSPTPPTPRQGGDQHQLHSPTILEDGTLLCCSWLQPID